MGKLGKLIGVIVTLAVVMFISLIAIVHYFLTEERVKALVIPQAENALGREVAIGDIKIGLLSGITIRDFLVKEADGQTNFVNTKAFVLSYKLLPLLQKKLVISEIRFDEPSVQIIRDRKGLFNFSTLALLSDKTVEKQTAKTGPAGAAIPLALIVDQMRLHKAHVKFIDQLGELPSVDVTTSAKLNVALGRTIADLQYKGSFDFDADISHGETQTNLMGKGNISQRDLDIVVDTDLQGEQVHVEANVKSYLQSPNATINISSKSLNIDKLLGLVAVLPEAKNGQPQKGGKPKDAANDIIAESLPHGLVAQGSIKVNKAMYKGLTTNDFMLAFDLAKGILTVKELSARAYGGQFSSNASVDFNEPGMAYKGTMGLQSVQAGDFSTALVQKLAGMVSGSLASTVNFSGAGATWDTISRVLTADGTFALVDGSIKSTPVSNSIATLLGLQELRNFSYENISGTFTIVEGGKVKIKTNMQGTDFDAEAAGFIGLDGSLDLPLTFHLSPALADKLQSKASFARYLTDKDGTTTLHLKLAGNIRKPQPTLDMKGVQEQIQKSLQKELLKQLDSSGEGSSRDSSPENMIKGLFGK